MSRWASRMDQWVRIFRQKVYGERESAVRFIGPEEEAELIASGEKPYSIAGRTEFEVRSKDGIPTGQFCRAYKMDPVSGCAGVQALSERTMTPEELNATEMRNPDGSVQAITYGEWKKRGLQ